MRISRLIGVVLFALCSAGSLAAQSDPTQMAAPADSRPVHATIYITAMTKKGFAADLKPEDLTITENKVPAKIEQTSCGKREPILIGILIDVSGSRRGDPHLNSHYDALVSFLSSWLAAGDGAYVIAFDYKVYKLSEVTSDRAAISEAFDKLKKHDVHGSTALYDAVKAAAEANFNGRTGRRIIVVLGDWEDNTSHAGPEEAVKAAQRSSSAIFAVMDADGSQDSKKAHKRAVTTAEQLTVETGGIAYETREKGDFAKILEAIGNSVAGSCRVEYAISKEADPKKGAQLHLQASSKDVSILYPRVRFGPAP